MSKEKLQQAQKLIQAKRYDEARSILETIDHPKAEEWLERLPKQKQVATTASRNKGQSSNKIVLGAFAIVILILTFIVGILVGREMMRNEIASAFANAFNYNSSSSPELDMTRTAISNANSTTEAHITETASAINMTRTYISDTNATVEALVQATQTASAKSD